MPNILVRAGGDELVSIEDCEMKGEVPSEGVVTPYADKGRNVDEDRAQNKCACDSYFQGSRCERSGR